MTLPDRLRRQAGKTIESERSKRKEDTRTPLIRCVRSAGADRDLLRRCFATVPWRPALGVAYRVLNEVDASIEGSPAAKAGMQPGDVIVQAKLIPPDKAKLRELGVNPTRRT